MTLDEALAHTEPEALVRALLHQWRRTPDPELADLIDLADRALDHTPYAGTPVQQQKHLRAARLKPPTELGRLLAALRAQKLQSIAILIHQLEEDWPDDPRLIRFYMDLLRVPPWTSAGGKPIWSAIFNRFKRSEDARIAALKGVDLSGGFPGQTGEYVNSRRTSTIDKRTWPPSRLTEADRAKIRARAEALRRQQAPGVDLDAALDAVLDAPEDPAPRHVYADALAEEGDARGEFVQLQLLDKPTRAQTARMRALLKENEARWLGPLDAVLLQTGREWRKGFLHAATLKPKSRAAAEAALGHPAWSTLRELTIGEVDRVIGHRGFELVVQDAMGDLEALRGLASPVELRAATERFPGLRDIGLVGVHWTERPPAEPSGLTRLEHVGLELHAQPWARWLAGGRLPRVTIHGVGRQLAKGVRAAEELCTDAFTLTVGLWDTWTVTGTRGGPLTLRVPNLPAPHPFTLLLAERPAGRALTLSAPNKLRSKLEPLIGDLPTEWT